MLLPNNQTVDYTLNAMLHLQAEQGAAYSVVDLGSGAAVEDAVLTRQADTLFIEIEGEQVATVEQFYAAGMETSVDMGAPIPQAVMNDAMAESANLVWEHAADAGAIADGGIFSAPLLFAGSAAAIGVYAATNTEDAAPTALAAVSVTVIFNTLDGTTTTSDQSTAFAAGIDYHIIIVVPSAGDASKAAVVPIETPMLGGANLGAGDFITVVGDVGGTTAEIAFRYTSSENIIDGSITADSLEAVKSSLQIWFGARSEGQSHWFITAGTVGAQGGFDHRRSTTSVDGEFSSWASVNWTPDALWTGTANLTAVAFTLTFTLS